MLLGVGVLKLSPARKQKPWCHDAVSELLDYWELLVSVTLPLQLCQCTMLRLTNVHPGFRVRVPQHKGWRLRVALR